MCILLLFGCCNNLLYYYFGSIQLPNPNSTEKAREVAIEFRWYDLVYLLQQRVDLSVVIPLMVAVSVTKISILTRDYSNSFT